ncbi:MAG: channel protein TolC [Betaproteobacteria bacterium RBG_16_58_11]|nr:MAG: channel protein TolC [Betaproteobacteria bacterium RBG_16_58_11]
MKKIPLFVALAFSPQLFAATDLLQVYKEAQTQDATFQAAKSAQIAGQEKLPQARALFMPSVNLSANTTQNETDTQTRGSSTLSSGERTYNSHGYSVSLNQPLYRAQNYASYAQAKSTVEQVNAQYATAEQDLVVRVAQAYFDVLLAQYNVTLAQAQQESIGEQLAQAKRNFEVGTATITDTHDAQARFDLTLSQEIAAQNDLEIKRRSLQQIINRQPDELVTVRGEVPLVSPEPNNMDAWVEKALAQNPETQIAKAAFDIASEEVRKARGGHLPTLDLVATYGDTVQGGGSGYDQNGKTIGLQMNLPIFAGGATSSKVREAVANQEKARQELDAVQRKVALQARQAYLGVTSGIAQVKALQQAVISNQSSLDSTKLGLEVGVRTSVDLLNARQQLFSARRDLAQALYGYIVSRLKLEAAAGDLNEADVSQVNGWLNQAAKP